ncbi:MAG: hypothetical protein K2X93_12165 [Candidatus Obscuribacterales bacterium]|nr:hypothetical protein [Candidatus Obscuribacterales bacterium]
MNDSDTVWSIGNQIRPVVALFDISVFEQESTTKQAEIEEYLTSSPIHIRRSWLNLKISLMEKIGSRVAFNARSIFRMRNTPGLEEVKLLIAMHPGTPTAVLDAISPGASTRVLQRIAEHPNTSRHLLTLLAYNRSVDVRMAVCENVSTPLTCIWALSNDSSDDVRYRLAEHASLPAVVMQALTADENPYVACRASKTLTQIENDQARVQLCLSARNR